MTAAFPRRRAFDVDRGGDPARCLYLGRNADLYVLVDPRNDDTVELVPPGATRLVVIDEVTCSGPQSPPETR